jgi:hypothetical protein
MKNVNERYDASLRVLTFALTGCRDACLGRLLRLAKAEYGLAATVRNCLAKEKPDRDDLTRDAISKYESCDWPEVPERAGMYTHFLSACHGGPKSEAQLLASPCSEALLQLLDVGMSRISQALEAEDLVWAEIEADHIHNLPEMLDAFVDSKLSYYLDSERAMYEERLRDRQELKHATRDWQSLADAWEVLEKEQN